MSMRILVLLLAACLLPAAASAAQVVMEDNSALQQQVGVPLYLWRDPAVTQPRSILIAVHGSAQEASVMDALARTLVPKGFVVVAPDVRGNGRWQTFRMPPEMADLQLMDTCGDVCRTMVILNHSFPNADIFCLGESIGAGVVLKAVSEYPKNVRGVILVSAGVRPHMHNPFNLGGTFLKGMATLVQPVDLTDYISKYCSEDPRVVREMLNDRLAKNRQTGLDLIGTFAFLRKEPTFAAAMPKNIPVLAIQGTADQIVDPSSIEELLNALPTKDKKLVTIPGCGHIIVGTSFLKEQVLSSIDGFLDKHAKSSRKTVKRTREEAVISDKSKSLSKAAGIAPAAMNGVAPPGPTLGSAPNPNAETSKSTASHGLIDPADFAQGPNNSATSAAPPDSSRSPTSNLTTPNSTGSHGLISPGDFAQTPASPKADDEKRSSN